MRPEGVSAGRARRDHYLGGVCIVVFVAGATTRFSSAVYQWQFLCAPRLGPGPAASPGTPLFELGGSLQPRFALRDDGTTRAWGFGLRRTRVRLVGHPVSRVRVFLQLAADNGNFYVIDASTTVRFSAALSLKAGRFVGAQPGAFALQKHQFTTSVSFPVIAHAWARRTRHPDGRDFGLQLQWRQGPWESDTLLHNGDGSWARLGKCSGRGWPSGPGPWAGGGALSQAVRYTTVAGGSDFEIGGFLGFDFGRGGPLFVGRGARQRPATSVMGRPCLLE